MMAALAVCFAVPAVAAGGCLPRREVLPYLNVFQLIFAGQSAPGSIVEVYMHRTFPDTWFVAETLLDAESVDDRSMCARSWSQAYIDFLSQLSND